MDWSLWQNTAWDYAANTRGYTDGVMVGYVSPAWSLKYGVYRMPVQAGSARRWTPTWPTRAGRTWS